MDKNLELSQTLRTDLEKLLLNEGITKIDWMELSIQISMAITCLGIVYPISAWTERNTTPWDSVKRTKLDRSSIIDNEENTFRVSIYGRNPVNSPSIFVRRFDGSGYKKGIALPHNALYESGEFRVIDQMTGTFLERRPINKEDIANYRKWLGLI